MKGFILFLLISIPCLAKAETETFIHPVMIIDYTEFESMTEEFQIGYVIGAIETFNYLTYQLNMEHHNKFTECFAKTPTINYLNAIKGVAFTHLVDGKPPERISILWKDVFSIVCFNN